MADQPEYSNPYEPPAEPQTAVSEPDDRRLAYPLGVVHLGWLFGTMVICVCMIFVPFYQLNDGKNRPFLAYAFRSTPMALGLLGGMASCLALVYSLLYAHRIVRRSFRRLHQKVRDQPFIFYVRSMLLGMLLTISTLTTFACCCVPTSIPFVQYSAGGGTSGDTRLATAFSVLVAFAVGGFIIRQLLPREDFRT